MRLGVVCLGSIGGSGILASKLGLELAERGHEVHVMANNLPPALIDRVNDNLSVHIVETFEYPVFKFPPYTVFLASQMADLAGKYALDLFHVHYAIPHAIAAFVAKNMTKTPYIVTLHGSDVHTIGQHRSCCSVVRFCIEKSDACTSPTDFLIERAKKNLRVSSPIVRIPNFVDTNIFRRTSDKRKALGLKGRIILHVSNFRPVKKVPDLIRAFFLVKKKIREAHLVLVGDGPEKQPVERLIAKLDLQDSVFLLGFRRDIPELLNSSDVFVLNSSEENMPLTLLEAMSCQIPVISTDVGGISEFLKHQHNGLLVSTSSSQTLAEGIVYLLQNETVAETLARNGRETIMKGFSSELVVSSYERLYEHILKKSISVGE